MVEKINSLPKAKPVISSSKARVITGERHALGAIVVVSTATTGMCAVTVSRRRREF